jgi:chromate reductase
MKKAKILAIVGSLRKDSFNHQLAKLVEAEVGERADFEILDYQDVPFYNQDVEFPAPEAVSRVRELVKEADGIWFFSPEYNHYFSGVLKNLLDWLSRPVGKNEAPVLIGKPAAVSGITPGMSGTLVAQDHLVSLISYLNMKVMNFPRLSVPNAMDQLDSKGKLKLTNSYQFLKAQTDAFLDFIKNK